MVETQDVASVLRHHRLRSLYMRKREGGPDCLTRLKAELRTNQPRHRPTYDDPEPGPPFDLAGRSSCLLKGCETTGTLVGSDAAPPEPFHEPSIPSPRACLAFRLSSCAHRLRSPSPSRHSSPSSAFRLSAWAPCSWPSTKDFDRNHPLRLHWLLC